jgi:hypothetical protein
MLKLGAAGPKGVGETPLSPPLTPPIYGVFISFLSMEWAPYCKDPGPPDPTPPMLSNLFYLKFEDEPTAGVLIP